MADLALLERENDQRWSDCVLTRITEPNKYGKLALKNKNRYIEIVHRLQKLGSTMPDDAWPFIAVIHYRESTMNFNTHLGQGDPLTDHQGRPIKTVHVPANRGPFSGPDAFEQAAVDALWYCAPYAAKINKDWSIGGMLTYLERFNGLAYANVVLPPKYPHGAPSPYVWAGTNQYTSGKVLVDHGPIVWSTVDVQMGVAGLLMVIDELDPDIDFGKIEAPSIVPDHVDMAPVPDVYDAVWLQSSLNLLGVTPQLKVDGIIGAASRTAIKAFQHSHHLTEDGKAGTHETIPAIVAALAAIPQPVVTA